MKLCLQKFSIINVKFFGNNFVYERKEYDHSNSIKLKDIFK